MITFHVWTLLAVVALHGLADGQKDDVLICSTRGAGFRPRTFDLRNGRKMELTRLDEGEEVLPMPNQAPYDEAEYYQQPPPPPPALPPFVRRGPPPIRGGKPYKENFMYNSLLEPQLDRKYIRIPKRHQPQPHPEHVAEFFYDHQQVPESQGEYISEILYDHGERSSEKNEYESELTPVPVRHPPPPPPPPPPSPVRRPSTSVRKSKPACKPSEPPPRRRHYIYEEGEEEDEPSRPPTKPAPACPEDDEYVSCDCE